MVRNAFKLEIAHCEFGNDEYLFDLYKHARFVDKKFIKNKLFLSHMYEMEISI